MGRFTWPPKLPSMYPKPGTVSSKVHGTFYRSVSMSATKRHGASREQHLSFGENGVDVVVG